MTTRRKESSGRHRRSTFEPMALAIELWLRTDGLDEPNERDEAVVAASSTDRR